MIFREGSTYKIIGVDGTIYYSDSFEEATEILRENMENSKIES